MIRSGPLFAAVLLMSPCPSVEAQLVPEGIHTIAEGPVTMCGITAASAQEFLDKVKVDTRFSLAVSTDRFVVYATQDSLLQLVFSKPGNTAHPLATCRHTYEQAGAWYMKRNMRCDDARERCDRAFLEFQALDEQAKRALSGDEGR